MNGMASLMNAAWSWVLVRQGRRHKSPALVADGRHLLTDVISSTGVIGGVALAALTGWALLDPALAVAVALGILWSGWGLMKESLGGLMDEAVPPETLARIREIISANADGAIEAHDLRTRHAGPHDVHRFPSCRAKQHERGGRARYLRPHRARHQGRVSRHAHFVHVEPEDKTNHSGIVLM